MAWREWLSELGIIVPVSPDTGAIALAALLVAIAFSVGALVRRHSAGPIHGKIGALGGDRPAENASLVLMTISTAMTSIILAVAIASESFAGLSFALLCVAFGAALSRLAYGLVRRLSIGPLASFSVATMVLILAAAGAAGGLRPLLDSLDSVGFDVGSRRFSLLSALIMLTALLGLMIAARLANRLLTHSIGRMTTLEITQRVLLQKLAGIAVIAVAILMAIDFVGIDLTALAVFSGAAGLSIGFGLQKTFGNLIAGLILLMDRSIKPGDVIVVSDTFGTVSKIGVRAVSVLTRDGKEHLIPNELLMTQEVENWSYSSRHVRLHIPVGVSYASDIALAQRLMIDAANASPRVLKTPAPTVWMTGYGDSSVDHEILIWIIDPEDGVGNVQSDILNRLWVSFKENGIDIPFPQRDIHVRSMVEMPAGK